MLTRDEAVARVPCSGEVRAFFEANAANGGLSGTGREHGIFSIMVLILEEFEAPSSGLAPYYRDLRRYWTKAARSRFPLFWNSSMRAELEGTSASELFRAMEPGVAREFELLRGLCPHAAAKHSLEKYRRVWALVNSRVSQFGGAPHLPPGTRGREPQSALLPIFDMANHFLPPPRARLETPEAVQGHLARSVGRFGVRPIREAPGSPLHLQLWVDGPLDRGDEVTDVYGVKANEDMLWSWGFTIPWIHNLTCLSSTLLTLPVRALPQGAPPRDGPRRAALLRRQEVLRFKVSSCLGGDFPELLAFSRFWHAGAADDAALARDCNLQGPEGGPWPASMTGRWRLGRPCKHVTHHGEAAALRLVGELASTRRDSIAGGSLEEEERLLAGSGGRRLPAARRDAAVLRRDEKYVLRRIDEWLHTAEAELEASQGVAGRAVAGGRKRARRRKGRLPGEL